MHDAHGQWPDDLIETQPPKSAIHPTHWRRVLAMAMYLRTVVVGMTVHIVTVSVKMGVLSQLYGRKCLGDPPHDPGKIQNTEKNQHQPNREFHCETYACRDHDAEQDDCRSNDEDRDRVAQTPEDSYQDGVANASLAAHNRRHGDDVVRIGGMSHPKEKTQYNNGEQSDHLFRHYSRDSWMRAPTFENVLKFADCASAMDPKPSPPLRFVIFSGSRHEIAWHTGKATLAYRRPANILRSSFYFVIKHRGRPATSKRNTLPITFSSLVCCLLMR